MPSLFLYSAPKKIHYKQQQMLDTAPPEMEISADFKQFTCKICGRTVKEKSKCRHFNHSINQI